MSCGQKRYDKTRVLWSGDEWMGGEWSLEVWTGVVWSDDEMWSYEL